MTHDSELVERLRAGLEGTTKGQWRQCGGMSAAYRAIHSPAGYIVFGMADAKVHTEQGKPIQAPGWDEQDRNARHIANCSPDNIRTLLDTIEALRARLAEVEAANESKINDWFSFCEAIGQTGDTHEAVAYHVNAALSNAESRVRELREGLREQRLKPGVRAVISHLHKRANEMGDWRAKAWCNSLGFELGVELSRDRMDLDAAIRRTEVEALAVRSLTERSDG